MLLAAVAVGLATLFWLWGPGNSLNRIQAVGGIVQRRDADPDAPVLVISLTGSEVTDAVFEDCQYQTGLKELLLSNTRITDDGLKWLTGLSSLQVLQLNQTAISDAGLHFLSSLQSLQRLELENLPHHGERVSGSVPRTSAGCRTLPDP